MITNQWGIILQLVAIAYEFYLITQGSPLWLARSIGVNPNTIVTLLLRLVPTFLIALDSCAEAGYVLLLSGSRKHFVFGEGPSDSQADDDSDIPGNAQLIHMLQEDPQTLREAQRQLELISSGVAQLEERILEFATEIDTNNDQAN